MIIVSWMYRELRMRIGSRDLYSVLYSTVLYYIPYITVQRQPRKGPAST
jgi:hypothetical protein